MNNALRITAVTDVQPNDIVLLHCTTDSKHVDGLRFTFAPCRVIERVQNTQSRRDAFPVLDQFGRFDWIDPSVDECYLLPTPDDTPVVVLAKSEPATRRYFADNADNDSPFVLAYHAYCNGDLDCYSVETLDEFESCAHSLLNRPAYSDDPELTEFRNALHAQINSAFVDAPDDAAHQNH